MVATRRPPPKSKAKTAQFKKFAGVNRTDSRTAIGDDELFWLENAIAIGNGSIQVVPGTAASVATVVGARTIWGATINGNATLLVVASDGSITQVTPGGVVTVVAVAGTVTTSAHMTTFQGARYLIVDPTKGYFSWDGTTFTTIDASKVGSAIAVFEGRVWIGNNRTIQFTAPLSYTDFTAANGAGSTIITDDAFIGNIVSLYSALEQLWVVSAASINAISNVQASGVAPSVVTTFTNTNIVTNLGTNAPNSVIAYFRSLTLLAPFGAYALAGVTPQKLSDKLDGLFSSLTFTDAPAAVAMVQNLPVLMYLTTYTGPDISTGWAATSAPLLLCFSQGRWFFGIQGLLLVGITTLVNAGVPQAWGCYSDGTVCQLFGASASTTVNYKIQSKLYDFGDATTEKALMKVGVEVQASGDIAPVMTVDSEFGSTNVEITTTNALILKNVALTAAQRITNGGFGTAAGEAPNLTGWTTSGIVSVGASGALLTQAGVGFAALQEAPIPITAGREHAFSVQVNPTGISALRAAAITITDNDTAAVLYTVSLAVDGLQTVTTTLTAATLAGVNNVRVRFTASVITAGTITLAVDNVSLVDQVVANAGVSTLQLLNNVSAPLNLIAQGTVLSRRDAALFGRYLGWTIQGTDIPFRLQAVQFQIIPTTEWIAK